MTQLGAQAIGAEKRVLIVDDSKTIRAMLRAYIDADPRLNCVGEAGDPYEARGMIKELNPDILTLDVEMPRMNGLVFLEHLMRLRPMPVVMVSTRTTENSETAIRALSTGAVDCIDLTRFRGDAEGGRKLGDMLWTAAGAMVKQRSEAPVAAPLTSEPVFRWNGKFVLIGSSTGGVEALEKVLMRFPANCPPTLVAQHMPGAFLQSFTERLNGMISPKVMTLRAEAAAEPGHVYFAAGAGWHGRVAGRTQTRFMPVEDTMGAQYVPSVDVLFSSAVGSARQCVSVMLTGMGRDGASAMKSLKDAGSWTIVQSGATSTIDGMPKAARECGAAAEIVDLDKIGNAILKATGKASVGAERG